MHLEQSEPKTDRSTYSLSSRNAYPQFTTGNQIAESLQYKPVQLELHLRQVDVQPQPASQPVVEPGRQLDAIVPSFGNNEILSDFLFILDGKSDVGPRLKNRPESPPANVDLRKDEQLAKRQPADVAIIASRTFLPAGTRHPQLPNEPNMSQIEVPKRGIHALPRKRLLRHYRAKVDLMQRVVHPTPQRKLGQAVPLPEKSTNRTA